MSCGDEKERGNIEAYIDAEISRESEEARREAEVSSKRSNVYISFVILKIMEFYWTFTRFFGLSHLHDGSEALENQFKKRRQALVDLASNIDGEEGYILSPGRRLFVDVSHDLNIEHATGIQRVVLEIAKAALKKDGAPVIAYKNSLFGYERDTGKIKEVEMAEGDVFFVAGAWWHSPEETKAILQGASEKGGRIVVVLYDIIPLTYRKICSEHNGEAFSNWFFEIISMSDAVICISKSVAGDFIDIIRCSDAYFKPNLKFGWNHLGADFQHPADDTDMSARIADICCCAQPIFLGVSTLEPRKGYTTALDAMDRLWGDGVNCSYVIVGRHGWNARALGHRIVSHPEYGRRLYWLKDASDAELRDLYKHARALIFPSIAEGFGLALIEAAYYGLPAIASDIPVFREIGGDEVRYFTATDSEMLAERVKETLAAPKIPPSIPFLTWRESTEGLLSMIRDNSYQFGELRDLIGSR